MSENEGPGAPSVVCLGEIAWDLRAPPGALLEGGPPIRPSPGGGAVTTALELARLGVSTGLCAAVGDDLLGRALRSRLEAAGVDVRHLVATSAVRTGLVFLASDEGGGRGFLSYRAPDAEAKALRASLPKSFSARALHISALLPSPAPLRLLRAAILAARGAVLSLDLNARPRFWRDAKARDRDAALRLLVVFDWIKASEDDLKVMGLTAPELLAKMSPTASLIVTSGPHPVRAYGPHGLVMRGLGPKLNVDPTGAGDAFCAGFLFELSQSVGAQTKSAPMTSPTVSSAIDRGRESARALLERR